MVAAPVWADQAQDAAQVAALSLQWVQPFGLFDPVQRRALVPYQGVQISGCEITVSQWFETLTPEQFLLQARGDLGRDSVIMQIDDPRGDVALLPPGTPVFANLYLRPSAEGSIEVGRRSTDLFKRMTPDIETGQDEAGLAQVLAEFSILTPTISDEAEGWFIVFNGADRLVALAAEIQRYADRWCRYTS